MGREHRLVPGLGFRDGDLQQQQQHPARDGAWGEPAVGVQCRDQPPALTGGCLEPGVEDTAVARWRLGGSTHCPECVASSPWTKVAAPATASSSQPTGREERRGAG